MNETASSTVIKMRKELDEMLNATRAGSLPFVIGLLVAVLPLPGLTASTAAALPYSLVLSPRPTSSASAGTVTGQFGGVPVGGTYSGTTSSGTLTLTVKGMTFV